MANGINENVVLTSEGFKALQVKLDDLINNKRKQASERIKEAREFGDLSENAEYDAAKDEQAIIEAEIKEIEHKLSQATIIDDVVTKANVVSLGSTVKIYDVAFDEKIEYTIVGMSEADISQNRISNLSPLAKAMMGHKKGETVVMRAPDGNYEIKILAINK
ncbi:MAG: transcription elongation factor GreA [Clostridia bacterium]